MDIHLLKPTNKNYPKLLREIYNPPNLYVRGEIKPSDVKAIAIVGTRKLSAYGKQVAPLIVQALARAGLTIVSGLALGIDTLAHKAALDIGGRTIAVLGGGIDDKTIFPPFNTNLAKQILKSKQGAVISEWPPGTAPLPTYFPQRNRIISGLSLAVVVIEAPIKSGALITARLAIEQNRDVFAIPGSILSKTSEGCNYLIANSQAKLVTSAEQILEELNLTKRIPFISALHSEQIKGDNKEEEIILSALSYEPIHINELSQKTCLQISQLNSLLSIMDIKGKVKNTGNAMYVLGR